MKNRSASQSGFSLVEVTLALGVVVFCLVTILGLLAVGINTTHVSTVQTSATNILTAIASDLEATPNYTPSYPGNPAKGSIPNPASPIYGIVVPTGGAGATVATQTMVPPATTSKSPIYIGENGQIVATAAAALYQLNYWIVASNKTAAKQETFARLLLTWPAAATYTSAQGYVEDVIAINRT